MVLDVALVPRSSRCWLPRSLAPPQAPSGAPPRSGLPPLDRSPSRPTGLARRLLRHRRCLARDGTTALALDGLAAGAAFDLWCAGGGENARASAGGVEKGVHLQVYGSGLRNKSSGLIRGFSRAVRRARVDAVARGARSFLHRQPACGWSTQARDQQPITVPSLSPPPPHTVPAASTCLAACSPPGAPPSGAPRRARGHRIAQMLFPGRRRPGRVRRSARRAFLGPPPTSRTLLSTLPDLSLKPRVRDRRARCAAGQRRGSRMGGVNAVWS